MPKRRRSKLDEHEADLVEWLGAERMTLDQVRAKLFERGVSVSVGRLSGWWQDRQQERMQDQLLRQIATGADLTRQVDRAFERNPAPPTETLIDLVKVLIMQLSVKGSADDEMLGLVPSLLRSVTEFKRASQKDEEIKLAASRFEWIRKRAEQADATEKVVVADLTDEERRRRIAEIYGRA